MRHRRPVTARGTTSASLLAAVLLAGCLQPTGSAAPSTNATTAPSATAVASPGATDAPTAGPTAEPTPAPSPEPTVEPTIEPEPTDAVCPTSRVLTVRQFVDSPRSCFDGKDVKIKGWLDTPGPLDFAGPSIRPFWLAYPETGPCSSPSPTCSLGIALWQDVPLDPEHICEEDREAYCSLIFPHSAPGTGLHFMPLRRWVILTGHTDDPAAERCHWEYPPEVEPGTLDDDDAVRHCRAQFVVTKIDFVDSV